MGVAATAGAAEAAARPPSPNAGALCVHNLSRFAQPAELLLSRWSGYMPVEVLGRVPFPVIGEDPYT